MKRGGRIAKTHCFATGHRGSPRVTGHRGGHRGGEEHYPPAAAGPWRCRDMRGLRGDGEEPLRGAGHGELINERYEKWMENGQNHATFTYSLGFFGKSWG